MIYPLMIFFSHSFFLSHDFHFHSNFCASLMLTKYHLFYPINYALNKSTLYACIPSCFIFFCYPQDSSLKVKTKLMLSLPTARDFIWKSSVLPSRRFSMIFSAMMRFFLSLSLFYNNLPTTYSMLRAREALINSLL